MIRWKLGEARCVMCHLALSEWIGKARPKQHPWDSVFYVTIVNGVYSTTWLFGVKVGGMNLVRLCVLLRVCVLPGKGDYNKSCINIELNQGELTNSSSCRACMVPAVNSILC